MKENAIDGNTLKDEKKAIEEDSRQLCLKYIHYLQSLDNSEWLKDRNHMVVSFLCIISGCKINIKDLSEKQKAAVIFALEQIYSLISSKIILPFTFSKNLILYYFFKSKAICTMNTVAGPGGSSNKSYHR